MKFKFAILFSLITLSFSVFTFGQADVGRRTTAITYPLDDLVVVQFRGTTRFPRMKGEAKIKRTSRNGTEIDLNVSKMPRPFELGAGYATYVLWAISPEGQVDNLGEIKRRGTFEFDSKMSVTTKLQTFSLIVTAEPHFLVRRPSQEVMLENLTPYSAAGKVIATKPAVQYFGNSSDFFRDSRTPEIAEIDYAKTPSTILQAKQAVALARYAGADRDATQELAEAESFLLSAENSWKAGRAEETVDITARQAVSSAVKAEMTAGLRKEAREKRNDQIRSDAETREAENRYKAALDEIENLKRQLSDETRNRELSERDGINYSQQVKDLRAENNRLRDELAKAQAEVSTARNRVSGFEEQQKAEAQRRQAEERYNTMIANQPELVKSLKHFGTVVANERGIVLTIPESLWASVRTTGFAPSAGVKLEAIGDLLSKNGEYNVVIESHTDDRGDAEELNELTRQRAAAISERFSAFGVSGSRIEAKGLGATLPLVKNSTNANRAKNRRVQITLVPNL